TTNFNLAPSDTQPSARTEAQNNTGYTRSHAVPHPQPRFQPRFQPQPQTQPRFQPQPQTQPRFQPQPQTQPRFQPQPQQSSPQRQQNYKQSQNPVHTAPISLQTIIRDKVDVSKLSVKIIKGILKENCIDYSKMVEKSELIERMEILIKWAKHEMS